MKDWVFMSYQFFAPVNRRKNRKGALLPNPTP
jgi:hypothetical protein